MCCKLHSKWRQTLCDNGDLMLKHLFIACFVVCVGEKEMDIHWLTKNNVVTFCIHVIGGLLHTFVPQMKTLMYIAERRWKTSSFKRLIDMTYIYRHSH